MLSTILGEDIHQDLTVQCHRRRLNGVNRLHGHMDILRGVAIASRESLNQLRDDVGIIHVFVSASVLTNDATMRPPSGLP